MSGTTQNACDVIILGGGVAGASSAMQLALRGLRVVVLERAMLGSGSTGRAAGLLGQLRSTHAATQMLRDGIEIVSDLQSRTGSQIFVQTGSLRVASTEDRAAEIRAHVALGREVGLDVDHIERSEVRRMLRYEADDLLDLARPMVARRWCALLCSRLPGVWNEISDQRELQRASRAREILGIYEPRSRLLGSGGAECHRPLVVCGGDALGSRCHRGTGALLSNNHAARHQPKRPASLPCETANCAFTRGPRPAV